MKRVVITGLGVASPIGNKVNTFWKNLLYAKPNYSKITRFPLKDFDKARIAGEIKNLEVELDTDTKKAIKKLDAENGGLTFKYGIHATRAALKDADIYGLYPTGVYFGSGAGDLAIIRRGKTSFTRGSFALANALPGLISKECQRSGPTRFVSAACATGNIALEEGYHAIQRGDIKQAVVGSTEAPIDIPNFFGTIKDRKEGQKGLSKRNDLKLGMIPFDRDRDGIVLSEGAGALVLEELEKAKKRKAKIYAEIVGYGNSTTHAENPVHVHQRGYQNAIGEALSKAGIDKGNKIYVNAHGTATYMNDLIEADAIRTVLGLKHPVSSFKGTLGHSQAAYASIELVGCALALKNQIIPSSNLQNVDTEIVDREVKGIDLVKEGRVTNFDYIIKNAAGFNGVYSTIVLKRYK